MKPDQLSFPTYLRAIRLIHLTDNEEVSAVNHLMRFHPWLRPTVWGGRHLHEVLGKALPSAEPYGEAWEISDHASHQSVVAHGPNVGRTLRELMQYQPEALLGMPSDGPFPWLIKFIDACDWLSVQVHPDDEAVIRLWPGEGGKTEAWFILAARPAARVYAGLLPGVDEKQLRRALAEGTVAGCLHSWQPQPGDCLFLPAGTVHAVGGGVLMAEVQQTSDATFRLFDWNRKDQSGQMRKLHVEEALACIDYSSGPVQPVRARGYPGNGVLEREPVRQRLVDCRYFHLDYVRQSEPFVCGGGGRMQALVVLHGRGLLLGEDGPLPLRAGETLLLPASLSPVWCQPEGALGVLLATLPTP
jgi:mannose-6-phosphate isomerase